MDGVVLGTYVLYRVVKGKESQGPSSVSDRQIDGFAPGGCTAFCQFFLICFSCVFF